MKIMMVAGARPNFMKIAPLLKVMRRTPGLEALLVHTGQHYDERMSRSFFTELEIPAPDIHLEVGSASHAVQTAKIMIAFEQALLTVQPDLVVVVGDVNSTIGCALPAVKLGVAVAHVEAGLRSFDRAMPEEINRILTDVISDYLFVTERRGEVNLLREGIAPEKIFFVGNVMIDTLLANRVKADASPVLTTLGLQPQSYALLTLHRPSNVDDRATFGRILAALEAIQTDLPIIFPVHPRTRRRLNEFGFLARIAAMPHLRLTEPFGYLDFLKLMADARFVLTDSGGIQEETTILRVPCLTLRDNTERPITVEQGTNVLVGTDSQRILHAAQAVLQGPPRPAKMPDLWDGQAAERIVAILLTHHARTAARE